MRRRKLVLGVTLILVGAIASPALAATFTCTPVDVTAFVGRVHVKCSSPADDGGSMIYFWAVSTGNQETANRFLTLAVSALVSGRQLVLAYTPGDTSGVPFGCQAADCRVPISISLH